LRSWTAPVLRLRREGVHRRQARESFQSPGCGYLAADQIVEGGHWVIFLSQLGFAAVTLGKLNEGGALVHARGRTWGQLDFQDLFKKEQ
jgi:hypothetical protein